MGSNFSKECSICLEPIEGTSKSKTLECGHQFHSICINTWLYRVKNCPECRHCITYKSQCTQTD